MPESDKEAKTLNRYWLLILITGALMGIGAVWSNLTSEIKAINKENIQRDALVSEQQKCLDLLRINTAVTNKELEAMNQTITRIEKNQAELLKRIQ